MPEQWYYQKQGQTIGPVSRDELLELYRKGNLDRSAPVIRDGMKDWQVASRIGLTNDESGVESAGRSSASHVAPPPPASFARASAFGQTTRRKPVSRTPLYVASVVMVAAVAAAGGWLAASLRSPETHRDANSSGRQIASKHENRQSGPVPKPATRQSPSTPRLAPPTTDPRDLADSFSQSAEVDLDKPVASVQVAKNEATPTKPDPPPVRIPTPTSTRQPAVDVAQPASPVTPNAETPEDANGVERVAQSDKPLVLFQELDIQRQPKLWMLGTAMAQDLHYRILSELRIERADKDGFRRVQQVVKKTSLLKADDLSRAMFTESLDRLIGWQFSYKLNLRNEVVEMRGPDGGKRVEEVKPAATKGFLVTSVMDEDGWKELAELTFFAPDAKGMRNQSWTRQMTHDFDELGSWSGTTTFVPRGKQQDVLRVDYAHELKYHPPIRAAAPGGLPFAIKNAEFRIGTAGGTILYDQSTGRVNSATEQFHVRGQLSADALGQVVNIPVEEKQLITVRVMDQNPWQQ